VIRKVLHIAFSAGSLLFCLPSESQDLEGMGFNKGIKVSGNVNLSNIIYSTNDTVSRRDPYQLILTGNLNLNIFGYEAPFSFTYSNSQKSYTQPFNRLSFTPQYKWIKAYLGYTSMSFSPYTLSGHSFKGAGFELTPGNWRMAIMYGQLKKAVEYDPVREGLSIPSYKRMGYGLKLGYEKGASGIIANIFSARDDVNSINNTGNSALHPMQNVAIGLSGRTTLFGHFALEGEYSVSILNSDLRYDTIQTKSSDEKEITSDIQSADLRTFGAISLGAGLQYSAGGVMLKYEKIDPDYQTLGAYYFNNDLENFTISPTLKLFDGRFLLSGNAGFQKNNLDKSRQATTTRFVGAGNLNLNMSEKLNFSLNYSNFSTYTNIKPQDDPFFRDSMDSLNFYQLTNQVGATANYSIGDDSPMNIMISGSYQKANEAGKMSGDASRSGFITANASCSKFLKGSNLTLSVLYNINSVTSPGMNSVYNGPGINLSKSFPEKKLRVSFYSTYNSSRTNNLRRSPVLSSSLNFNYSPGKNKEEKHNFTSGITFVQRFHSPGQKGRYEVTGNVSYAYSF
jgi:hypothetical protein